MFLNKYLKDCYDQDIIFNILEVKFGIIKELIVFSIDITILTDIFRQGNNCLYSLRWPSWNYSGKVEWYSGLFSNLILQDTILCSSFSKEKWLYPDPLIYSFIYFSIQQIFFEDLPNICTDIGTRNIVITRQTPCPYEPFILIRETVDKIIRSNLRL